MGNSGPGVVPCHAPSGPVSSHSPPDFDPGPRPRPAEDLAADPGAGVSPVAVGGGPRDPERLGGLLDAQPGEVAELDQPGRLGVFGIQAVERLVDGQDLVGRVVDGQVGLQQLQPGAGPPRASAAPAGGRTRPGSRRIASAAAAKKWPRPSQRRGRAAGDQPEVRLVDQSRGLERLAGFLLRQPPGGELAELLVDQGQKFPGGPGVAPLDGREDTRDIVHRRRPAPGISSRWSCKTPSITARALPGAGLEAKDPYCILTLNQAWSYP